MFDAFGVSFGQVLFFTALASFLAGVAKGGFGGSVASLCVPVMSLGVPPLLAISLLLPVLNVIDLFTVRAYWGQWNRAAAWILIPSAIFGVGLGAIAITFVSGDVLRGLIGCIAIGFGLRNLQQLFARRNRSTEPAAPLDQVPTGARAWVGRFWGTFGGITSHIAHAGGVPMSVWLLGQGLDRRSFVATSALFFLFVNIVKLVPYSLNGQFSAPVLLVAAMMIPVGLISVFAGVRLNKYIPDRVFFPVVAIALVLTGIKLLYDSFSL